MLIAASASADRAVYAITQTPDAGVNTLAMDTETGELTLQSSSPVAAGSTPGTPSISPDGKYLFVADWWDGFVRSFDLTDGTPTQVGAPVATGLHPNAAIVKPSGSALWVANYDGGTISAYDVGSDGSLTESGGSPIVANGEPTTLAASPEHHFVYVPGVTDEYVSGFESNNTNADLSPLPGSPFTAPDTSPVDAEFSVDGEFLFTANQGDASISSWAVECECGDLYNIDTTPTGGTPAALAASPDGRWLAVANQDDDVITMYTISPFGQLTQNGFPAPAGGDPWDLAFSPDSRFVYAANYGSGDISGYRVTSHGEASPLSGSPFAVNGAPLFSLAITPNQGPIAAATASVSNKLVNFDASGSSDPDGSVSDYHWEFGDGIEVTTNSPQISHNYANAGTYSVELTVLDNEDCTRFKVGTGQTLNCNGSSAARKTFSVTTSDPTPAPPAPAKPQPISLTNQIAEQVRGSRTRKRVRIRFNASRAGQATIQFRSVRPGRVAASGSCTRQTSANTAARRCRLMRNFGRPVHFGSNSNANSRTFVRTIGGRTLGVGSYVAVITSVDSDGVGSNTAAAPFRIR